MFMKQESDISSSERMQDSRTGRLIGKLIIGGASGWGATEIVNGLVDKTVFPPILIAGIGAIAAASELIWQKRSKK